MPTLFATSLLVTSALFAQEPLPRDPGVRPTGLDLHPALPEGVLRSLGQSLLVDDLGNGTLWASGPKWKASFGPDGFTYVPFLGSDAPRNFPVHFALESVTVGGEPLEVDRTASASRSTESQITLDRRGLREVYHLSESGVEQTFVFDELPRSGEIVVRMSVESDLEARADGAGWTFVGNRGGVRYGSATGIAANGSRMPLEERLVDGALEIRVPASELTPESFPFVVDPILTTIGVTSDARDQVNVDVAYDATSGVYMIVYEEAQSASDHDIRSVYYNTAVDLLLNPASIDISSENWVDPSVANSVQDSVFLCVATRGALAGLRDIWGRTRDAGSGSTGAPFAITTFPGDNTHADVGGFGGDPATAFPFLVVWQNHMAVPDDYDVYAQAVDENGALQGPLRAIANSASEDDMRPQISKSSGNSQSFDNHEYLVAWERPVTPTDRDIWTRVVDYTGSTTGHDAWLSYSFGDSLNVAVSSQNRTVLGTFGDAVYVLAFERLRSGIYEIFTVVTREGNADNARSVTEMQDIALSQDHADPRIAYDGTGDYMIAYKSEAPGGFDAHVTVVNVVADGSEFRTGVVERRASFEHATGTAGALAIGSTYEGGLTGQSSEDSRAMVLLTAPGPGGDEEVSASIVEEVTLQTEGSQFCRANDNDSGQSAWLRAGTFTQPTDALLIDVQDLPLNAFGYVIASLDTGFTANPGGSAGNLCLSGAIGRFNNQVVNSGMTGAVSVAVDMTAIPQPNGSTSALLGERWKFQYWTRDTDSGMPTSNFSNAVVVYMR
ncbi:MAG: hypothetical protein AAGG01_05510 [Planctomycetota bacterium]